MVTRKNPGYYHTTAAEFRAGNRVQLHPATDMWMRGAKYGEVARVTKSKVFVKLDRTGRTVAVSPSLLEIIESNPARRSTKRNPAGALRVEVWEERDNLQITLYRGDDELASWSDDDARQMFEDGFFERRNLTKSVIAYAEDVGLA